MASVVYCIVLLCVTSGLWMEAEAKAEEKDCESCPPGWTKYGSRCFIYRPYGYNWYTAERHCIAIGGNLASIQSTHEYNQLRHFVKTVTKRDLQIWVGGHDAVREGVWLWSDGSKFSFGNWGRGEPNNVGGKEHCMEINFAGRNYVNDAYCGYGRTFVCSSSLE